MKNQNLFEVPCCGYENTGEGGMWCLLVVFDEEGEQFSYEPAICVASTEVFIGSDEPFYQSVVQIDGYNVHFNSKLNYRAAVHLGNTSWSGSDEMGEYWRCTFESLTFEGKLLYNMLKNLYPESKLYLLTFLDT